MAHVVLAGSGNIGTVIGGVSPGWGPFGALGTTATTVIDLTMAVVLVICFGGRDRRRRQAAGRLDRAQQHAQRGRQGAADQRPGRRVHRRLARDGVHDHLRRFDLGLPC